MFSCRFLGQVTLINSPHKKEDLEHQNKDVGKGMGTKAKHQNSLKPFKPMLDPLGLTNRSFRLVEESLPTPCIKVSTCQNVKQQQHVHVCLLIISVSY